MDYEFNLEMLKKNGWPLKSAVSLFLSYCSGKILRLVFGSLVLFFNISTLTGGLLLKKRWKTALWFSSGFLIIDLFDWAIAKTARHLLLTDLDALEVYPWVFNAHAVYLFVVVAGVFLSSFYCLRRKAVLGSNPLVVTLAIALTVLSCGSTYITFSSASGYVFTVLRQGGMPFLHPGQEQIYESIRFHKDIYLEDARTWGKPSLLAPSGQREINGVITMNGKPAITTVKLYLNDSWRTETIWTDKKGRFSFPVGLKTLEVNRIDLDRWRNKPNDQQQYMPILVEPVLEFDNSFADHAHYSERIQVSDAPNANNLDLRIELVPFIEMVWPKHSIENEVGSPVADSMDWSPVKDAHNYQLKISRYTSDSSARPHMLTTVSTNSIKLADLPLVSTEKAEKYYIEVYAFDVDGRFLGATRNGFGEMVFSIGGNNIVKNYKGESDCK